MAHTHPDVGHWVPWPSAKERAPGTKWSFPMSPDHLHLPHHSRTLSAFTPSRIRGIFQRGICTSSLAAVARYVDYICSSKTYHGGPYAETDTSSANIYVITCNQRFPGWKGTWPGSRKLGSSPRAKIN